MSIHATLRASLFPLLVSGAALAQGHTYDVTILANAPGAYLTFAQGMNDHAEVVGASIFIPGGLKGWIWSESQGYTILPKPPGMSDYGAVDINNVGVIAGDGGGDSGGAWRYTAGTYEMLGVLPGTVKARTQGLNESGSLTGSCFGSLFNNPRHSFLALVGSSMVSIMNDSQSGYINESDQVAGYTQTARAYRYTPGIGIELLPPLGGRNFAAGYSINNAGKVVGYAYSAAQHDDVPFIFSDAGGMQEVGNFGGRAFARDVNDLDQVVGEWEPANSRMLWVWSASQGVRFLHEEIDPAVKVQFHNVWRINNAGQILCSGFDQVASEYVDLLLTPIGQCPGASKYCGAAQNPNNAAGIDIDTCDSASSSINIGLYDGPVGQFTFLLVGDGNGTISQPPGAAGDLCVAGGACLGRYDKDVGKIDAQGRFSTDIQNALSNPCGGAVNIDPGVSWNFQYWHRRPGGQLATFSEALAVTFH